MPKISFTKMVASGNDFVVIENSYQLSAISYQHLAKKICARKYGVGADGLLLLGKSKIADVRMRIFNSDGSEAEMCGNGARCVALYSAREQRTENREQRKMEPTWAKDQGSYGRSISIETKAGIVQSQLKGNNVKIKLTNPLNISLDIPVKINKRNLNAIFIDIGVAHAVIFVEGLDEIHVSEIGRAIRNHKRFFPRGANVDFVEGLGKDLIGIRTYERGVE
ncbi:MAG: diaminopimelate epimerase, partial [Candidatus Omnitrophota bacterium]|nr:diaminopimelate epimerase [Candidatus Omnitrophota bacterium]